MGVKSWIVTIVPLVLTIGATIKAVVFGADLTPQEIEMIKWIVPQLLQWFGIAGGVGGAVGIAKLLKSKQG